MEKPADQCHGSVPEAAKLNMDHALPRYEIVNTKGFKQLPRAVRDEILNDPRNYQPMVKPANCSKGCKVEGLDGGWESWNGKPVSAEYKKYLREKQDEFRAIVTERIRDYQASARGE